MKNHPKLFIFDIYYAAGKIVKYIMYYTDMHYALSHFKTKLFLTFSGGIERDQWQEMGLGSFKVI